MQPRIQYARRPDGARTAYTIMGSGPVLMMLYVLDAFAGDAARHIRRAR